MDTGGLAADADGQVLTIWMRKKEIFHCTPEQPEVSLGKGEQGGVAYGPGGFYLVWIVGRPGSLLLLRPGADKPSKLADRASDPVVAGAIDGQGPVVVVWEEGQRGALRLRAAVLSPASRGRQPSDRPSR